MRKLNNHILKNEPETRSFENYTVTELCACVNLLFERIQNRNTKDDKFNDLMDAQIYLNMLYEHIEDAKNQVYPARARFLSEIEPLKELY